MPLRAFLPAVFATLTAAGQTHGMGDLKGLATDQSGKPLPGIVITIISPLVTRTATTDEKGTFQIHRIPPGEWFLRAVGEGVELEKVALKTIKLMPDYELNLTLIMLPSSRTPELWCRGTVVSIDMNRTWTGAAYTSGDWDHLPLH